LPHFAHLEGQNNFRVVSVELLISILHELSFAFGCKSVSSLQVPQLRELMVRICGWQRGNKRDLIKHIWSKACLSQPYPAAMQYVDFLFSLDSLEVTERANINSGEPLREAWI
jgi:hypothetical protein